MSLAQAAAQMAGSASTGADAVRFERVVIDSRQAAPQDLFFALAGPRFDGHDFLSEVQRAGAAGAVVERATTGRLPTIRVDSTRRALGRLGAAWRRQCAPRVVAVTGSNGKTTVKEMVRAVLETAGPVLATRGNLNNDIGVPLSLLGLRAQHRFGVFELGMNAPGEIAYSAGLAAPDMAVITNAAAAHLEGLGSVAAVAQAKGEIIDALPDGGVLVVNRDDDFFDRWRARAGKRRVVSFGVDSNADVTGVVEAAPDGIRLRVSAPVLGVADFPLRLRLLGIANARNALAAVAVGLLHGCTPQAIGAALADIEPVSGRLDPLPARGGARLIDDSYNANPGSARAALEAVAMLPGRKVLLLGDMAELGENGETLHRELGVFARGLVDRLCALGDLAGAAADGFGTPQDRFVSLDALLAATQAELRPGTVILVKGSRSARMERAVEALRAPPGGEA